MRRFRTGSTDFRRKDEAETLRVLARLDVGTFFRRHRPNDGDDDGGEADIVPLLPSPAAHELS